MLALGLALPAVKIATVVFYTERYPAAYRRAVGDCSGVIHRWRRFVRDGYTLCMNWANLSKRGQQCLASWFDRAKTALRHERRRQLRRYRYRLRVRRHSSGNTGVTAAEAAVALALLALLLFSAPVLGWWVTLFDSWIMLFVPWLFIVLLAFLLRHHTDTDS